MLLTRPVEFDRGSERREGELSRIFASWNQIAGLLKHLHALRIAA
jgi:hypothetical protein